MRSKLRRARVEGYLALVYPAILVAPAILVVAVVVPRFEGKASPERSTTVARETAGVAADQIERTQPVVHASAVESYGKLPLGFEINKGQTDSRVKFLSRGSGYSLFLTGDEAVLALRKQVQNANGKSQMAKGVWERWSSYPAAFPRVFRSPAAAQGSADLFSKSAAFPPFFRPPAAEWRDESVPFTATNNEPKTTDALLRMRLVAANPNPRIVGMDQLPGKSNYFIGNDPKNWRTNVPNYAKVKYANVYPGVDLVYYGNQGKLEYDFVVQPGADPNSIQFAISSGEQVGSRQKAVGRTAQPQDSEPESQSSIDNRKSSIAAPLHVNATGDLVVGTDGGEMIFHKPVVYQPATYDELRSTNGGGRDLVEGQYVLRGDNRIGFQLADYDRRRPVVIDPVLAYSTYLGGSDGDQGEGIAVDASGNVYVTGSTGSSNFPTTPGAFETTCGGGAFVTKFSAGSALVYSTYLCGGYGAFGSALAVDVSGNAYVAGGTTSPDFPTTPGAFQTTLRGTEDAFVSKLDASGSVLLYSTYLGGANSYNRVGGATVDSSGNAYVVGWTAASDFPITPRAFQTTFLGNSTAFVSKLNPAGSALVYSTFLGSASASGIAVDASGNAFVTGEVEDASEFPVTPGAFQTTSGGARPGTPIDAFVSKLNPAGSALVYSTFLGGSGSDQGNGIAVDGSGNAYVTGWTESSNFPTTPGAFQDPSNSGSFVTKLNPAGSTLVYSTSSIGGGNAVALNGFGNAYVTGGTYNPNFPTTPNAWEITFGGGNGDAFVSKLNAVGSGLLYSTYLGGRNGDGGDSIAVDASGNIYVTGHTGSANFPTTPGAFQTTYGGGYSDAFVAKISFPDVPFLVLTPRSLSFAPQATGTTSVVRKVRLRDVGAKPLDVTTIVASGDFAQTNDCTGTIAPAGFCTLSVTFTPTATGIRTGAVTITDNAAGSPHMLPLTGTGGIPAVSLTPASLTFPAQWVGTTSPAQPATLKNTGSGPLSIVSITGKTPSGDFAQSGNCGSTVNPGASCTLNVIFAPTGGGTFSGSIIISDDAPDSPQQLSLAGTGLGPVFGPAPFTFNTLAQGLDGNLYGTSGRQFFPTQGTVFKVTPAGTVTTLYNFGYGDELYAGLVLGTDGNFYGTTSGTVFQITSGGVLTTLHTFEGSDGYLPEAALVQGTDGKFYGTTSLGGAYNLGTIFRMSSGGAFATVHNFQYLPHPQAALVQASDGNFYGATANGGTANGCGVVFRITPSGAFNSVHQFGCTDGAYPEGALVEGSDGKLYGTTAAGGASGNGIVFRVGRLGGGFATLHSFASTDGSRPGTGLIQGSDGNFYGTTWVGGSSGCGTLFQITPAGTLTTLYNFNCTTDGFLPYGAPVQHTNGTLYATNGVGQVFSLNVGLGPFVKTVPAAGTVGEPVTILGTNLTGATSVSFNGTGATFTVVSSSEITTTVPTGATTGQVQVVTPSGTLLSNVGFRVVP
jgi:uncharacterized repeat protein (TIGR03803 family)